MIHGELKYGPFCVSFMLNASLSHFLTDSDSIFHLFIYLFICLFCGDFPFLAIDM
jgi:hypothetical protein